MPKRISSSLGAGLSCSNRTGAGDHAGRAEPALKPVVLAKGLLQRMEAAVGPGNSLDGHDFRVVRLGHEHGAGLDRLAVEINGAGPAVAGVAADMRAGQRKLLAQQMDEQHAWLGERLDRAPIDRQFDMHLGHQWSLPQAARSRALANARAP